MRPFRTNENIKSHCSKILFSWTKQKQLNTIGINTLEDLVETGSREAWLRIRAIDSSACYNRLCGLEGAIQGIRWHYLDEKQIVGAKPTG